MEAKPRPGENHDASAKLFERARQVMPSGYTRHLVVAEPHPFYADHANGCWIVDVDGNRQMDWVNNFSSLIHGHNKRELVDLLAAQAGRLMSAVLPTEWEVKLAELLCDRIPSVERVRFANSGTEANQIAIKAARAFTGRTKIAKMEGGYHGQYDLLEASFQSKPSEWGDPGVRHPRHTRPDIRSRCSTKSSCCRSTTSNPAGPFFESMRASSPP